MSMRHTATVTVDNLRITYTYAKGYRVSYRPRGEGWTKIAWFAFSQDLFRTFSLRPCLGAGQFVRLTFC